VDVKQSTIGYLILHFVCQHVYPWTCFSELAL